MSNSKIHLVECPRDAMQGWQQSISTRQKVEYINALLQVGFDTIDFGSFVSSKLMPQMADTKEVIKQLVPGNPGTKLLAIVANARGAEEAAAYDLIDCLGYPFSISATFQQRNANSTIEQSLQRVEEIRNTCVKKNKQLVVYISMAFGNPYEDPYSDEIVFNWVQKIAGLDIKVISLADTVGVAEPAGISRLTQHLVNEFPSIEIGVHLHSTSLHWKPKLDAALQAGCTRFDGALKGIGGCPMADDVLVGNMNTEWMISYFKEKEILLSLNEPALRHSLELAQHIFKL